MLGALLKRVTRDVWGGHEPEDVYLCSVMPCVRKKGESMRPEFVAAGGVRDVDEVITTRDLGALLRRSSIHPGEEEESGFDSPLGQGSGAGQLFGVTGGVMVGTGYDEEGRKKKKFAEGRGGEGRSKGDILYLIMVRLL